MRFSRWMAAVAGVAGALLPAAALGTSAPGPVVAKVFATREGLVGGRTANGHVITARDQFASLPSRLGLSGRGGGERTVRVCRAGRCVFLPVWDVGPWNTTDDYWNSTRQTWTGLPVGMPEAQAAYQRGYNGGKDEFGRRVSNPAGIDLADGAFWDGLKLTDNAWVDVAFLWTGGSGYATVATDEGPLMLRSAPSVTAAEVGFAARFARIPILCQVRGQPVASTDLWDRVAPGMYVSHAFIATPQGWSSVPCDPVTPVATSSPATSPAPSSSAAPPAATDR